MNYGDLRHVENYAAQANLTPEQTLWSESWGLLRRMQAGKGKLKHGFVGLIPANRRVVSSLGQEYIPAEDVLCMTMLPMRADRSTRFHKESRPVRLQVTVARFHRDEEGRPILGGGPSHTVFEADGAKHPTQDHPMVRVACYDPRRGEVKQRYGIKLFQQVATSGEKVSITSPTAGIFVSDTKIMDGWVVYLLDGLPICRFPEEHAKQVTLSVEEGAVVQAGEELAAISGRESFEYHLTTYTDGKPDMDDYRVLSPLHGDTNVRVDELYASVFVNSGNQSTLVARFHADDVASGKVELMPEREVRGTGKFERTRDVPHPSNRIRLRTGDEWASLVEGSETGEEYTIARLVSLVEYGLAEFHKDGAPVWDQVNFTHDIVPVTRPDCKVPLRLLGKMLALARKLMFHTSSDEQYPMPRPIDDNYPTPYAVFSKTQLNGLGMQPEFTWSFALKEAARIAVSPKGSFVLRFDAEGDWTCTGYDNDTHPAARVLYFKPCHKRLPKPSEDEPPETIELEGRPWTARKSALQATIDAREADPDETAPQEEVSDAQSSVLTVCVPKSAAVRKNVFDGEAVSRGSAIADWVPRQFYPSEELEELLGNNLPWFANEFLKEVAVPRDCGDYLLPDAFVPSAITRGQGLVLRRGEESEPGDGVVLLTPLSLDRLKEEFTWAVNGIWYDVTPPHLVEPEPQPSSKKGQRYSRGKKA